MTAQEYAKILFSMDKPPKPAGLKAALARRGHTSLAPRVIAEYKKLQLQQKRIVVHKKVTPETERKRVLLQLYRKLTHV